MKGKELFNVLILCCCLLILSGSFLPYISVNFPNTNAGWGARSVIQEQLPEMFDDTGNFQSTAVDLIASMQTENKCGIVKWWFIAALFLNLVCVLSLLMENKVKYILIMLLDVLQAGLWFGGVFLLLPYGLVRFSGIGVTPYTGPNVLGIIRNQEMAELCKILLKGMQIGYWMPYFVAFVSFVLCIVALVVKPKKAAKKVRREDEREKAEPMESMYVRQDGGIAAPGITCVEGPYAGSHAPMEYDEEAVVGNDEDACSLVILSDRVSPVHCRVRFDKNRNEYQVMSVSMDGTFINGYRMEEHQWLPLQRGACLKLGADENILRLD